MTTCYTVIGSPLGPLVIAGTERGLTHLTFPSGGRAAPPAPDWRADAAPFAEAKRQLDAYFARALEAFELPLAASGTPFQREVWRALSRIPYGTTISYGELARAIGRPAAVRAVGAANGKNPLPIVVPCHRVIGADGSLTGFGGGLDLKRRLLEIEGVLSESPVLQGLDRVRVHPPV
jgi:methylated-DNA-[protein]-cysteine S-methyltransferase